MFWAALLYPELPRDWGWSDWLPEPNYNSHWIDCHESIFNFLKNNSSTSLSLDCVKPKECLLWISRSKRLAQVFAAFTAIVKHIFPTFLQGSPKASRAQSGSSCRALIMFGKGNSSCRWTAGPDVRSFCAAPVSSSPPSRRAKRGRCTSCHSSEEK